jgi:hypothetical protein
MHRASIAIPPKSPNKINHLSIFLDIFDKLWHTGITVARQPSRCTARSHSHPHAHRRFAMMFYAHTQEEALDLLAMLNAEGIVCKIAEEDEHGYVLIEDEGELFV